jgi:hypothetical protein
VYSTKTFWRQTNLPSEVDGWQAAVTETTNIASIL